MIDGSENYHLKALPCEQLAKDATDAATRDAWAAIAIEWHALAPCSCASIQHRRGNRDGSGRDFAPRRAGSEDGSQAFLRLTKSSSDDNRLDLCRH